MVPDAFSNAISQTRRRLINVRRLHAIAFGAVMASVAILAVVWFTRNTGVLFGVALIAFFSAVHVLRNEKVSVAGAAIWLDRLLAAHDLLPSVLAAEGEIAALLRRQANAKLEAAAPWPKPAWPVNTVGAALVLFLVVGSFTLIDRPTEPSIVAVDSSLDPNDAVEFASVGDVETRSGVSDVAADRSSRAATTSTDGTAAVPGISPAVGDNAATTDTLNVTTPRRESSAITGNADAGSGADAAGAGDATFDGTASGDRTPTDAAVSPGASATETLVPLPPRWRDLIDAYYR